MFVIKNIDENELRIFQAQQFQKKQPTWLTLYIVRHGAHLYYLSTCYIKIKDVWGNAIYLFVEHSIDCDYSQKQTNKNYYNQWKINETI